MENILTFVAKYHLWIHCFWSWYHVADTYSFPFGYRRLEIFEVAIEASPREIQSIICLLAAHELVLIDNLDLFLDCCNILTYSSVGRKQLPIRKEFLNFSKGSEIIFPEA